MTAAANPLSIRERAVLAEQENERHAKLSLAQHDTTHELNEYATSGGSLDDHRTVAGYCPTCDLHIVRVYWVSGRIDDSLMSTEQKRILSADGRYRSYGVAQAEAAAEVTCPACDETVSLDDFDEKAKTCNACERKRAIESGEAARDWAWGRDT